MKVTAGGASRRRALKTVGVALTAMAAGCLGTRRSRPRAADAGSANGGTPAGLDSTRSGASDVNALGVERGGGDGGAGSGGAETDGAKTATGGGGRGLSGVRGAVYFPFHAYNAYQTWANYDREAAARDVGFAAELGLDALRVFASYEFWRHDAAAFTRRFDHFLGVAGGRGVAILPVLFESIGDDATPRSVAAHAPVRSPSKAILTDAARWRETAEFVRWFAGRYGGREEVIALEIMNEPGEWAPRVLFVREMLRTAREADESVPLTVGCRRLSNNRFYRDPALDVYQFHDNLPPDADRMRATLAEAAAVSRRAETPVWLTEWQRTLEEPPGRMLPNYASLASVVRESDLDGDFFWQLMLNPAYNLGVRRRGRINGLFTDDGGVYSAADARALTVGGDRPTPTSSDGTSGGYSDGTSGGPGDAWTTREVRPDWIGRFRAERGLG
ncbi:MAG: glycoside hydrolase [Salinigranum sp.]